MDNQQTPSRDQSQTGLNLAAPMALVRAVVLRDWRSRRVALVACAVAAVVTAFQYQVYTSFVRARSLLRMDPGSAAFLVFDTPGADQAALSSALIAAQDRGRLGHPAVSSRWPAGIYRDEAELEGYAREIGLIPKTRRDPTDSVVWFEMA